MTDAERLFLSTVDDLRPRVTQYGIQDYEILQASALLRKLLIDPALVHIVNREHHLKLTFLVCAFFVPPGAIVVSSQDGFDPEATLLPARVVRLNLDRFLAFPCSVLHGQTHSVKDHILLEANAKGGVHLGAPRGPGENALNALSEQLQLGGYRSSLRQLQAIGRVTLHALDPLVCAIDPTRRMEALKPERWSLESWVDTYKHVFDGYHEVEALAARVLMEEAAGNGYVAGELFDELVATVGALMQVHAREVRPAP